MIRRSAADEISASRRLCSAAVSARETPADDWIYLFGLANPATLDVDPERLASNPQQALPIESEDASAMAWVDHIDLWIGELDGGRRRSRARNAAR